MFGIGEGSAVVWEQLLRLAEGGDLRAIKLYYEMLEKHQRQQKSVHAEEEREMEQMAAIRRAVFGDAADGEQGQDAEDDDEGALL